MGIGQWVGLLFRRWMSVSVRGCAGAERWPPRCVGYSFVKEPLRLGTRRLFPLFEGDDAQVREDCWARRTKSGESKPQTVSNPNSPFPVPRNSRLRLFLTPQIVTIAVFQYLYMRGRKSCQSPAEPLRRYGLHMLACARGHGTSLPACP